MQGLLDEPLTLKNCWPLAQVLLDWMHALFGAPISIFRDRYRESFRYKLLSQWLRAVETFVRRLLLAEAALIDIRSNTPPPQQRKHTMRTPGRPGFASDDSADWGVSFRLHIAPPKKRPRKNTKRRDRPLAVRSVLGLAERFEALIRVAHNPKLYAQRAARRLKRDKFLPQKIMARRLDLTIPPMAFALEDAPLVWRAFPDLLLENSS